MQRVKYWKWNDLHYYGFIFSHLNFIWKYGVFKYNNKAILIDPCVDVNTLKKYDVTNLEAILIY